LNLRASGLRVHVPGKPVHDEFGDEIGGVKDGFSHGTADEHGY
jgi:hypothetical protein